MLNFFRSAVLGLSALLFSLPALAEEETPFPWLGFTESMALNEEVPKPVIVYIYTDWAGWGRRMDAEVWSDPEVQALAKEAYFIRFDGERKDDVVFQGQTFSYNPSGRRGYHELSAAMMENRLSYPTTVMFDEEMRIVLSVPGFRSAEELHPVLMFIIGGHSLNVDFDTYKEAYVSPYPEVQTEALSE